MKLGVSLPFGWLLSGGYPYGDRDSFLDILREKGISSVEIRYASRGEDPAEVFAITDNLWKHGFTVTSHGGIHNFEDPASDILRPFSQVLPHLEDRITVTLHPPVMDGMNEILERLAERITKESLPFRIAVENNRRLPDNTFGDAAGFVARTVESCRSDCVGICFDMGHYFYYASEIAKEPLLLPAESFRDRVIHTHIHGMYQSTTHFPLSGKNAYELPLDAYVGALFDAGYRETFNLELEPERFDGLEDPVEALLHSIDSLKAAVVKYYG